MRSRQHGPTHRVRQRAELLYLAGARSPAYLSRSIPSPKRRNALRPTPAIPTGWRSGSEGGRPHGEVAGPQRQGGPGGGTPPACPVRGVAESSGGMQLQRQPAAWVPMHPARFVAAGGAGSSSYTTRRPPKHARCVPGRSQGADGLDRMERCLPPWMISLPGAARHTSPSACLRHTIAADSSIPCSFPSTSPAIGIMDACS